jgi:hypothetical protein
VVSEGATTAREFADAIDAAVVAHVGGPVQDDVAIVVLRLPDRMEAGDTSLDVRVSDAARSS